MDRVWRKLRMYGVLVGLTFGALAYGQAGPAPDTGAKPAFDVVAIKPNKSGSGNTSVNWNDTTFKAENVSLKILLEHAYGLRQGSITGLTGWAESDRFDINAKVVEASPEAAKKQTDKEQMAMLAAILADRFGVKAHRETKVGSVYELVVAKDGPKLTPTTKVGELDEKTGVPKPPPSGMSSGRGKLTATGTPLNSLAAFLAKQLGKTVIDKTGLTGYYDLELKWSPEETAMGGKDEDTGPSLFTAVQEQLGLKLQAGKGPVETLVVDSVEKPTEN